MSTAILFDGLQLYEPFHLRLLQGPSSVLDERVVGGLDVHAGGFTAEYGDQHERGDRCTLGASGARTRTTSSA